MNIVSLLPAAKEIVCALGVVGRNRAPSRPRPAPVSPRRYSLGAISTRFVRLDGQDGLVRDPRAPPELPYPARTFWSSHRLAFAFEANLCHFLLQEIYG